MATDTRMKVRTPMTRDVIVAPPNLPIADAWRVMQRERIRHLPVTLEGRLVGILSDRDLLAVARIHASRELTFPNETVAEIMTVQPIVCAPSCSVGEAARILTHNGIDALPVVAKDRLIGMVTSTDLLRLLIDDRSPEPLPFDFRIEHTDLTA